MTEEYIRLKGKIYRLVDQLPITQTEWYKKYRKQQP